MTSSRKATNQEIDQFIASDDLAIRKYIHPEKLTEIQLENAIEQLRTEALLNPIRSATEDTLLTMSEDQVRRYRQSCIRRSNVYVKELLRRQSQ